MVYSPTGSLDKLFLIPSCMTSSFLSLIFSTLYLSSLWRTDTIVFVNLKKPPPLPTSNVFEYNNSFSHVQCSLFLLLWKVSRMLTGGLDVIGVFAFGPSDMLTKSQAKLRQLLYSITKAVYHKPASYFDDLSYSRILLQICSATKKYLLILN